MTLTALRPVADALASAYCRAREALELLDETADAKHVHLVTVAHNAAWRAYEATAIVLEQPSTEHTP